MAIDNLLEGADGEFAVRHVPAKSDDGRIETVRVMVDADDVKHFFRDASPEFDPNDFEA